MSLFPLLLFLCHYHVRPATMRLVSRGCWNSTQCSFCSDTETSFLTGDVRDSSRKDGGGKNIVVDVADGSCRCNQTLCGQLVVNGTCWSGNHSYSYDIDLRGKVDEQDPLPLGYRCVTCGDAYAKRTETPGWEYNVTSGVGRCVRSLIVKDDVNDNTGGIIIESNATKPNIIERCVCLFFDFFQSSSSFFLLTMCRSFFFFSSSFSSPSSPLLPLLSLQHPLTDTFKSSLSSLHHHHSFKHLSIGILALLLLLLPTSTFFQKYEHLLKLFFFTSTFGLPPL